MISRTLAILTLSLILLTLSRATTTEECIQWIECCAGRRDSSCCAAPCISRDFDALHMTGISIMMRTPSQNNKNQPPSSPIPSHSPSHHQTQQAVRERRIGISLLRTALRADPENLQYQAAYATALSESAQERDRVQALWLFLKSIKSQRSRDSQSLQQLQMRFNAAVCAMSLERYQLCLNLLSDHDWRRSGDAEALELRLGCAHDQLVKYGHFEERVRDFGKMVAEARPAISKSNDRVKLDKLDAAWVLVLMTNQRLEEALQVLDKSIADGSGSEEALFHKEHRRASVLSELGKKKEASESYEKLIGKATIKHVVDIIMSWAKVNAEMGVESASSAVELLKKTNTRGADKRWMNVNLAQLILEYCDLETTKLALLPLNQTVEAGGLFASITIPLTEMEVQQEQQWLDDLLRGIRMRKPLLPGRDGSKDCSSQPRFRGVIVYMCGPKKQHVKELITSIQLLTFYQNYATCYDILIFHEGLSLEDEKLVREVARPAVVILENIEGKLPEWPGAPSQCCGVQGFSVAYRQMCAFFTFGIFRHPRLLEYEYYWRLDTDSFLTGKMPRDPMRILDEDDLDYAFVGVHPEPAGVVRGLQTFAEEWAEDAAQRGLNVNVAAVRSWDKGCIYNNYEAARISFFTSAAYQDFAQAVEKNGGIFMARWGDAPLRMIAVRALLDPSRIIRLSDAFYWHKLFVRIPK